MAKIVKDTAFYPNEMGEFRQLSGIAQALFAKSDYGDAYILKAIYLLTVDDVFLI